MNALPAEFIRSLDGLPGVDPRALAAALESEPPVSIRFNPYKLAQRPDGDAVPWTRYGYYLDGRPQFTLDPMLHGGAYYVQEASSMFIEHIYREAIGERTGTRILDLCAAPGGKTTLLSTLAGLEAVVVANETVRQRAVVLADNVKRWGLGNTVVTNNDPAHFEGMKDWFDLILVDAPCSGEGMFRKDPAARGEWSMAGVAMCARRQRRILADIWGSLKPGGVLVYSTCTFNRAENEDNVAWLCEEYGCEPVAVGIPDSWGVVESGEGMYRFYPDMVRGEGFFAAVVRKPDGKIRNRPTKARKEVFTQPSKAELAEARRWVGQPAYMYFAQVAENIHAYYAEAWPEIKMLAGALTVIYSGVRMGQMFHGKLRPDHPLALFHDLSREAVPEACIDVDVALEYLRKHDPDPSLFAEGINLVNYEGLPLGWLKRIAGRVNNMYPKELRIVNL